MPAAQYTVAARLGCVVSRGVRNGARAPAGVNSSHPCHRFVPSCAGAPHARAAKAHPVRVTTRHLYSSSTAMI